MSVKVLPDNKSMYNSAASLISHIVFQKYQTFTYRSLNNPSITLFNVCSHAYEQS